MFSPNMKNPDCNGSRCTSAMGEVRLLPYGGDGNLILCHSCYLHEMEYRRKRNIELASDFRYDIPKWEDLNIYEQNA